MYKKITIAMLLSISLIGCGSIPSSKIKTTKYKSFNSQDDLSAIHIDIEDIDIYEGQYPEGIEKDGDLIRVKPGYEDRIQLLGSANVDLKKGVFTSPFPMGPKSFVYVNNDDLDGLTKYCKAMNWQNGVFVLLWWIPNYLGPWNYPCYFQKNRGGNDDESTDYRLTTMQNMMKKAAQEMGGNAVIGYSTGGIAYGNSTVAHTDAWIAKGYIVKFK